MAGLGGLRFGVFFREGLFGTKWEMVKHVIRGTAATFIYDLQTCGSWFVSSPEAF